MESAKKFAPVEFTPAERDAIAALRATDATGASFAQFDDVFLSYFLFARKLDVARAHTLLIAHLAWRVEMDIAHMDLVAIKRVLMSGVFSFLPPDRRGPHGEGVGFIVARNVPDEMLHSVKTMMQVTWFLTERLYRCKLS